MRTKTEPGPCPLCGRSPIVRKANKRITGKIECAADMHAIAAYGYTDKAARKLWEQIRAAGRGQP